MCCFAGTTCRSTAYQRKIDRRAQRTRNKTSAAQGRNRPAHLQGFSFALPLRSKRSAASRVVLRSRAPRHRRAGRRSTRCWRFNRRCHVWAPGSTRPTALRLAGCETNVLRCRNLRSCCRKGSEPSLARKPRPFVRSAAGAHRGAERVGAAVAGAVCVCRCGLAAGAAHPWELAVERSEYGALLPT